jgi:enamine deaminase RidA (YjgF/YER057c/UK114 family)
MSHSIRHLAFLTTVVLGLPTALHAQAATPAPMSARQVINPPGIAPLVPAYSVAVRDGDLVYVSGMTGIKPGTQDIIEGGVVAQTRQTMENAVQLTVPLRVDTGVGPNWMEAK